MTSLKSSVVGDLCTMEGMLQKHYLHRVPKAGCSPVLRFLANGDDGRMPVLRFVTDVHV